MAQIDEFGKLECRSAATGEPIAIDPKTVEDLIPYFDGITRSTVIKRQHPERPLVGVTESPSELLVLMVHAAEAVALVIIERLVARAMR